MADRSKLRSADDIANRSSHREICDLRVELARTKDTLKSLISWMAQSANSPLSRSDAMMLLRKVDGDDV